METLPLVCAQSNCLVADAELSGAWVAPPAVEVPPELAGAVTTIGALIVLFRPAVSVTVRTAL